MQIQGLALYLRPINFKDADMTYNPVKYYMRFFTQYIFKMHKQAREHFELYTVIKSLPFLLS